jgi:hypothetical protein
VYDRLWYLFFYNFLVPETTASMNMFINCADFLKVTSALVPIFRDFRKTVENYEEICKKCQFKATFVNLSKRLLAAFRSGTLL